MEIYFLIGICIWLGIEMLENDENTIWYYHIFGLIICSFCWPSVLILMVFGGEEIWKKQGK